MLLLIGFQAIAKTDCPEKVITVNSITALNKAIDFMEMNSTTLSTRIIVEDGVYTSTGNNLNRNIFVSNTALLENACPCTIKAETEQGVWLKGNVAWKLNNSKKLTIDGFIFLRNDYGYVSAIIDFGPDSENNVLKNSNFIETSTENAPSGVNLYVRMNKGINNSLENNIFQNKYSKGSYVLITNNAVNPKIENSLFSESNTDLFPVHDDPDLYNDERKRYIHAIDSENLLIKNCTLKNKYSYLTYIEIQRGSNSQIEGNIFKEDDDSPGNDNGVIKNSLVKAYIKLIDHQTPTIILNTFLRKFSKGHCIDYSPIQGYDNLGGLISKNYFGAKFQLHPSSMIKIGSCLLDDTDKISTMNVTVSDNTFEEYNYNLFNYTEIISNKSSGNSYLNNTFINCSGNLRIRCGNNVTVAGNKFYGNNDVFVFGDDTDFNKQGGIFVSGKNHKIYNNYFESLSDFVIQFLGGSPTNYTYERVEGTHFSFNTAVNCKTNIHFRNDKTIDAIEMPRDCVFDNNIFSTDGEASTFNFYTAFIFIDDDFTLDTVDEDDFITNSFDSNIFYENGGHTLINSDWPQTEINPVLTTTNPELEFNTFNNMFLLTENSPAINGAINYSYVTNDILDNPRVDGFYDIGCHEYQSTISIPSSISSTGLIQNLNDTQLQSYPNPANDIVTIHGISDKSSYQIYNINGVVVQSGKLSKNQQINVEKLAKGMYFLTLNNQTIKIMKN